MKAAIALNPGSPDVVEVVETETPEPTPGQVLVKVLFASVNPVDAKMVEGAMGNRFPMIVGFDFAGTVDKLGEGVEAFKEGDRVFGQAPWGPPGSFAKYCLAVAEEIAPIPGNMDPAIAACLPVAGTTAHQALFEVGRLGPGETVLIAGASGGVGAFAVQLAKRAGAHVVASASAANREFVTDLGADEYIAYDEVSDYSAAGETDLVLDCVGGDTTEKAGATLKPQGRIVTIANFAVKELPSGIPVHIFQSHPEASVLTELGELVIAGDLKVTIEARFPLDGVREALAKGGSGHARGKVVIKI